MFGISHFALADSTISGKILKTNGDPVIGDTVYLRSNSNVYVDTTDANGNYTFTVDDAPITDSYTLIPNDINYIYEVGYIIAHSEYFYPQSRPISIVDGVNQADIDFTMSHHGMVSGKITDSSGNPIDEVLFYMWDKNGQSFYEYSYSDILGNYYATPLYGSSQSINAQGNYQAYVFKEGYLPVYISSLAIVDNQTLSQNVTLTGKSHVSGNIKSKKGTNLADIVVKVYRLGDDDAYAVSQSDANGNYQIDLGRTGDPDDFGDFSAKGKYILEVAGDDTSAYTKKSKNISVTSDESSLSKNFTLSKKKGSLSGKVKTKKNTKIEGAMVKVNLISDPQITSTTYSDSSGRYSFAHLTTGNYQITVSKDGYVNYEMTNKKIKKGTKKTFKLTTAGNISGYVFDNVTKKPLSGIYVYLVNSDIYASTNSQGYYVIKNVPTGNRKIYVRNYNYQEQFYFKASSISKAKTIKVKKNKENKKNNFYLTSYQRTYR
jgi:hypothetical protein